MLVKAKKSIKEKLSFFDHLLSKLLPNSLGSNRWMLIKLKLKKVYIYVCEVRGTQIKVGVNSHIELFRCETYEAKEPETLDWIDQVKDEEVLFDIGANIGLYTLYAAKCRNCRVIAFEPESQNFSRLVSNIYLNKLENVTPYCLAVSNKTSLDVLYVTGMIAGDSQHNLSSENTLYERSHSFLQGAMSVSLDQLCFEFNLQLPDHIKIDVDGIEKLIILGGTKVLSHPKVKTVLIEINQIGGESSSTLR